MPTPGAAAYADGAEAGEALAVGLADLTGRHDSASAIRWATVSEGVPPPSDRVGLPEDVRPFRNDPFKISQTLRAAGDAQRLTDLESDGAGDVPDRAAMRIMGRSTGMRRRYQHLTDPVLKDAAGRLDQLLWEARRPANPLSETKTETR